MLVAQAGVLTYAYTATKALLEVFLIGFSGYIFARNGTLTKPTLKSLSLISVNLLTPALMFSKMTETLDPVLLVELWNEPVFYFIYGGLSLAWSRVGSRVLRLPGDYARLCDVATFFSNANTLPVSLIKSIALSSGTQFLLKDANDTPLLVAARGVSYAMIFATLNNILRWSFGVALLGGLGSPTRSAFNSVCVTPRTPAHQRQRAPRLSGDSGPHDTDSDELTPLYLGDPAQALPPRQRSGPTQLLAALAARARALWEAAQPCLSPPVYAIVAAFVVIMIDPLHASFMDPDSPLNTLWRAIDMCGDACVPLILISLGGQLGLMAAEERRPPFAAPDCPCPHAGDDELYSDENDNEATRAPSLVRLADQHGRQTSPSPVIILRTDTDAGGSSVELSRGGVAGRCPGGLCAMNDGALAMREQRRGILLVLVGRFVFVPTVAVVLISTLRIVFPTVVPILAADPIYMLTLLVLSGCPPAINLITVSQATGKFETEAAQILFYGYVLGILVLAVEVSGFLWLTSA
ncbi:hypothetical protein H4R21_005448, partial [Coemansia helicoidea]